MIELMQPEFNKLGFIPKSTIYRWHSNGKRYYFTIDNSIATFYPSVTTVINDTVPSSPALNNLRMELGREYNVFMRRKAHHGTFMHIAFADYLKSQKLFVDDLKADYATYMNDNNFEVSFFEKEDFIKHFLGIIQWVRDYEVEPLLIEQVVTYNDAAYKLAGALDLYCEMNFNKKRVKAIIDLKSGAYAGFFREHEIQLLMYKMAFQQTYDADVDLIANLSPKNWRKEPTYDFKNQTNSNYAGAVLPILELAKYVGNYDEPKPVLKFAGEITNESINYELIPASEFVLTLNKTKEF